MTKRDWQEELENIRLYLKAEASPQKQRAASEFLSVIGDFITDPETRAKDLRGYRAGNHADASTGAGETEFEILTASNAEMRLVRWLLDKWIPLGVLALTVGYSGVGKSTFHSFLAAAVSRGKFRGEFQGVPRDVIMVGTEDAWEEVVVPRLEAHGASLKRVHWINAAFQSGEAAPINIKRHMKQFEDAITKFDAAVLSLDPLISYMGEDVWSPVKTREYLEPLKKLAQDTKCTIIGNAHFNKSKDEANQRVANSSAFNEVPRVVISFVHTDDGAYVMQPTKLSLGPKPNPRVYELAGVKVRVEGVLADYPTFRVRGESMHDVNEILTGKASNAASTVEGEKVKILQLIRQKPFELTKSQICMEVGNDKKSTRKAFDELEAEGLAMRSEEPKQNPSGGPPAYTYGPDTGRP